MTPGTNGLYTGGLDVKLGLRSNLIANFAVNTDFADDDVDTQQFNLTPYPIFFPEKRQFFLENAGDLIRAKQRRSGVELPKQLA